MVRLAVVGVGRIGGEVAYLAAALGIVNELVLYDSVPELLKAQILDLQHTGLDVTISTDRSVVRDADICLFSAGLPRNPSVRTRADLLDANMPATNDCLGMLTGFSGVLITVTNPMDINNFYLCKKAGIPRERCIGFGGQLDSARLGIALNHRNISGTPYVLGEHGEHQVPVFSSLPTPVPEAMRDEILSELRGASMEVIKGKGGTVFGPTLHMANLIRMVLSDSRELTICSAVLDGEYEQSDCSLGVPARIGSEGILAIEEWKLDRWESEKMNEAGAFVRELAKKAVS
ncbi:MAG: lactate dehydrogenase [Methanomicrobiales archaeon HGW-Methanomicrobiales-3]|jgi:malate dehydrogenase|nr:MAG: lactate dehydrogenase [Methanomicrobiales archaeon HGW-Methanomicrobiales-3]